MKRAKKLGRGQPLPLKAVLVQELREFARVLGRTPTVKEVKKAFSEGLTHSEPTYYSVFGSFTAALKAAGLPVNYAQPFSREQLIKQLKNLATALGRLPSEVDVRTASQTGACARPNTFKRMFGTFYTALVEARLTQRITEEGLIAQLKEVARTLRRLPSHADIDQAHQEGMCASVTTYARRFGSVRKARIAAGLGGKRTTSIGDNDVLLPLKELATSLGRSPTLNEVKAACKAGECHSANVYARRFGTFHNALKAAGIKITTRPAKVDRRTLIRPLRDLTRKLGRVPTNDDLDEASRSREISSRGTYVNHFGSLKVACEEARLAGLFGRSAAPIRLRAGRVGRPHRYTKEQLIMELRVLARKLRRIPTKLDINLASRTRECARANTYVERFGNMKTAVEAANLKELVPDEER